MELWCNFNLRASTRSWFSSVLVSSTRVRGRSLHFFLFRFGLVWFANCMRSQKLVRSISFRAVPYVRFGLCCYCELIYNYYSILRVCFISSFHFGSKSMGTFSKTGSFFMPTTRAVIYTYVFFSSSFSLFYSLTSFVYGFFHQIFQF